MSEPFIGEIIMVGFNFAPRGWALCDGQLLSISQNSALFSLFGTIYGGDGRTYFALPDLRGRVPIHMGIAPGLTPRPLGQKQGQETVTLLHSQMPSHNHTASVNVSRNEGDRASPQGAYPAVAESPAQPYAVGAGGTLAPDALDLTPTGGGVPHENMQPFLSIHYAVALVGLYPSRS